MVVSYLIDVIAREISKAMSYSVNGILVICQQEFHMLQQVVVIILLGYIL